MRRARVFISWSRKDSYSYKLAKFLHEWLPRIVKNVDFYVSSKDIDAGEVWLRSILNKLKKSEFGIVCLTKESLQSKWVLFEAGAIAHYRNLVCPVLIDLSTSEVPDPLSIFQSVQATREGILKLLESINKHTRKSLKDKLLKSDFEENWPKCDSFLRKLQDDQNKSFWNIFTHGMKPDENIYIVLSAKWGVDYADGKPTKKPGHTVQVSYNEVKAFFQFQKVLKDIQRNVDLVYGGIRDCKTGEVTSPEFPNDGTLIILGSKHANDICRHILSSGQLKNIPFRHGMSENKNKEEKCIKVYQDNEGTCYKKAIESFPSIKGKNKASIKDRRKLPDVDYGIILRTTNPLDKSNSRKVLILGGNHGFATESAIKFITDASNCNALSDVAGVHDFELLFEASIGPKRIGLKLGILKLCIFVDGEWSPIDIKRLDELKKRLQ